MSKRVGFESQKHLMRDGTEISPLRQPNFDWDEEIEQKLMYGKMPPLPGPSASATTTTTSAAAAKTASASAQVTDPKPRNKNRPDLLDLEAEEEEEEEDDDEEGEEEEDESGVEEEEGDEDEEEEDDEGSEEDSSVAEIKPGAFAAHQRMTHTKIGEDRTTQLKLQHKRYDQESWLKSDKTARSLFARMHVLGYCAGDKVNRSVDLILKTWIPDTLEREPALCRRLGIRRQKSSRMKAEFVLKWGGDMLQTYFTARRNSPYLIPKGNRLGDKLPISLFAFVTHCPLKRLEELLRMFDESVAASAKAQKK